MRGIIEKAFYSLNGGGISSIYICGDDGTTYFGHHSNFTRKNRHYKEGRTVTFGVEDNGKKHLDATCIDVEVPENPQKPQDQFISIKHLQDGAIIKRILTPKGEYRSLLISDGTLVIDCLSEYEAAAEQMYYMGPAIPARR